MLTIISIIISLLAFGMSAFILIKDYFLPAKIQLFIGDSLQIVHSIENKLQLNCNFTNTRNNLGVINKLGLEILSPDRNTHKFEWRIFYYWDGWNAVPQTVPTSLSVLAKSSIFQGIEFVSNKRFTWIEGQYKIIVKGLYNNKNLDEIFCFYLDKETVEKITKFPIVTSGSGNKTLSMQVKVLAC